MWYTLPRGKDHIIGPSVRLSEILASAWGNFRVQSFVVETTATTCTARGVAIDLESNYGISRDATVPIHGRGADAIKMAHMRAMAVAERNATFKVIPGAYQKRALDHARRVYQGEDIEERRKRMVEWFNTNGVTTQALLDIVQKDKVTDLDSGDVERLRGMANRIVDENKPAAKVMQTDADQVQKEEAEEIAAPSEPEADTGAMHAVELDARKKFGNRFDDVWAAAREAAGTDFYTLRNILSAPKNLVAASLKDSDVTAALLSLAKAAGG